MPDRSVDVQLEEVRGKIKGVEREMSLRHEEVGRQHRDLKDELGRIRTDRETAHTSLKAELKHDHATLKEDLTKAINIKFEQINLTVSGVKGALNKWLFFGLTAWAAVTGYALKSQWEMSQQTQQALLHMTEGAQQVAPATPLPRLLK